MPTDSYTFTAAQVARMQAAVGAGMGLMTTPVQPDPPAAQIEPVPRVATVQECHNYWLGQMKVFVLEHERREKKKAAIAALTDTAFDPT